MGVDAAGEYMVTWQQLHAGKHLVTTVFEPKFNEGYVYVLPLLYRHKVGAPGRIAGRTMRQIKSMGFPLADGSL